MSHYFDRLARGERVWAAEVSLRVAGLLALAVCCCLGAVAHRLMTTPQPHRASLSEFALCVGMAVSLNCGLALTMDGPKLFARVPNPRRIASD